VPKFITKSAKPKLPSTRRSSARPTKPRPKGAASGERYEDMSIVDR